MSLSDLPALNAALNTASFFLLSFGYQFIRNKKIAAHRACMVSAMITSTLFLISYLVYHFNYPTTRFTGTGIARPIYFTILFSHVTLAIVIVPLVIITAGRALRGDFQRHRKIARITFPIWMYVSITGLLVYVMLYQLYPTR